ncbi:MAG: hypothetical protein WCS42_25455 [Verrucomicrobiota bacterium]
MKNRHLMNNSDSQANSDSELYINPELTKPKITIEVPMDWKPVENPRKIFDSRPEFKTLFRDSTTLKMAAITTDFEQTLIHILRFMDADQGRSEFAVLDYCSIELRIKLLQKTLGSPAQTAEFQKVFGDLLEGCRQAERQRQRILQKFYMGQTGISDEFDQLAQGLERLLKSLNCVLESYAVGFKSLATSWWGLFEELSCFGPTLPCPSKRTDTI